MATTNRITARQGVGDLAGEMITGTTTSAITAGDDRITDSKLYGIGYDSENYFNRRWVIITGTNNDAVIRKISDFNLTSEIIFGGATLTNDAIATTFEIHEDYNPDDIHKCMNQSSISEYEFIWNEKNDHTLHTFPKQNRYPMPSGMTNVFEVWQENYLCPKQEWNLPYNVNGSSVDFEDWAVSTYPDGSAAATQLTLSKYGGSDVEQEYFHDYGDYICKVVTTANQAGSHYWDNITASELYGITLYYVEAVYCKTADLVKVVISEDGGSTVLGSSSYHGGTGWELLIATATITNSATNVTAGITVDSDATAFTFFRGYAFLTQSEYIVENMWKAVRNWRVISSQIEIYDNLAPYRFLRVRGKTPLSEMSSETDTIEIGYPQTEIFYRATLWHLGRKYNTGYDEDTVLAGLSLNEARRLYRMQMPATKSPRMM